MLPALQILIVIHVMSAMVWFGGTVFSSRRIRDAVTAEPATAARETAAIARQSAITTLCSAAVFVSGIGLALLTPGGFAGLPSRFHVAISLTAVWMLIDVLFSHRSVKTIAAMAADRRPLEPAATLGRKLAMVTGIQHTLFTIVLVLMLWKL